LGLSSLNSAGVHRLFGMAGSLYDCLSYIELHETTTIPIWTKRYDDTFNKIAITENYNRFDVTVLLKPETKKKMIDHLNDNCKIVIDMNIELVSASYVSTKMQCRGEFIKTNSDNLENDFKLSGKEPMCFWNGNIMYSEKDVVTRL